MRPLLLYLGGQCKLFRHPARRYQVPDLSAMKRRKLCRKTEPLSDTAQA